MNNPISSDRIPIRCNFLSAITVPNVPAIMGPIRGDINIAATMFTELFSTSPTAATMSAVNTSSR